MVQHPLVLRGFTWQQYLSFDELCSDSGARVRFLHGDIEVMAPVSEEHEHRKSNLGCLVEHWCLARGIRFFIRGNTTMTLPGRAGGEPDEAYCFGAKKEISDLVIEVALSSGGIGKRAFYREFRVPELWFWRNDRLEVHVFDEDRADYVASDRSQVLPGIDLPALEECARLEYASDAIHEFRRRIESRT